MKTWTIWIGAASLVAVMSLPSLGQDWRDRARGLFRGATNRFVAPRQATQRSGDPQPQNVAANEIRIERHMTRASDGWKLVATRYQVPGKLVAGRMPVILCHGFGYNGRFFDMREDASLARYLAQAGFDVWAVDLRGSGLSSKWAPTAAGGATALLDRVIPTGAEVPAQGFGSLDFKYANWTMDDHVDKDVPALIDLVKQKTGAPQVAWVGHSMGGNVMLAYLSKYGNNGSVGRLATVGSQVTMPNGQLMIEFLIELFTRRQGQLFGNQLDAQDALDSVNSIFFNEANTDPIIQKALSTGGVAYDMPSINLIKQYRLFADQGKLTSENRQVDYSSGLSKIQIPTLVMAGSVDQVAPPRTQRELLERISSNDKTLVFLGRHRGMGAEYGHSDSLVGLQSSREVYPLLSSWLAGQRVQADR
ncbi:Alpha/beta hydrolase family protein [Planctomycetes bacterium Pan216]|uniref:Alpha/beta hydrolase family protein n=1 Tax=Kolteria novifilia TaxID=2527975 RepID=A0A518B0Q4_9BACT|nr:Alpha/beta hydrolase family protein [Planctomycetes bacterium Pan216]